MCFWFSFVITIGASLTYLLVHGIDNLISQHADPYIVALWKSSLKLLIPGIKWFAASSAAWIGIFSLNHVEHLPAAFAALEDVNTISGVFASAIAYVWVITWIPIKAVFSILMESPYVGFQATYEALRGCTLVTELLQFPFTLLALIKMPAGNAVAGYFEGGWVPNWVSQPITNAIMHSLTAALVAYIIKWLFGI